MLKEQVLSVFIFLRIPKEFNVTPPTIGKTSICPIVGDDTLYLFSILLFFLLTYFHCNHIIIIETGILSSKILFAHRWRLISDRFENIVRSPEASNKYPARKFQPCRMAGLIL